jgi:hypothetical protein
VSALRQDRRLQAAAGAMTAILVALLVVLVAGGSGRADRPPANDAAKLVPADALVYVHLSTDTGRSGVRRALRLANRFPSYPSLRDGLIRRLSAPGCRIDTRTLKGREAALALVTGSGGTAGSLVLVDTGTNHRTSRSTPCGALSRTFIGRFLVIGQPASLRRAAALARGRGASLAGDPTYRKATDGLPAGRVLDAWASRDGVRRLLAPQGGLLGAAGVLLDQPGLRGTAVALTAQGFGARITVRSELERSAARPAGPFGTFTPTLDREVPASAFAYLGVAGLSNALGRLLSAAGPGTSGLAGLLARAKAQLERQSGGRLDRDLLALFKGEVAIALTSSVPAPVLTIIARTAHPTATSAALALLQGPLSRIFAPPTGPVPKFVAHDVAGTRAYSLRLAPGIEVDYAVFGGKLVVSTSLAGIRAVLTARRHLSDDPAFRATVANPPGRVTSLLFLDFSQLLRLGEQTGLNDSRAYLAVKDDLRKVRAVGAHSSRTGDESTAEILLSIP